MGYLYVGVSRPRLPAESLMPVHRFTREMKDDSAGLLAAAFIGIVPGYISRSVAGSYDNEAIAIFLLMFTFLNWIKALKQGSAFFGAIAAVFYFYMVAAWGTCACFGHSSLAVLTWNPCRWICVHHQHDPSPRTCSYSHGSILQPALRCIFQLVFHRYTRKYASSVCWFPACPDK